VGGLSLGVVAPRNDDDSRLVRCRPAITIDLAGGAQPPADSAGGTFTPPPTTRDRRSRRALPVCRARGAHQRVRRRRLSRWNAARDDGAGHARGDRARAVLHPPENRLRPGGVILHGRGARAESGGEQRLDASSACPRRTALHRRRQGGDRCGSPRGEAVRLLHDRRPHSPHLRRRSRLHRVE
jgi:hypothetical protein